MHGADKKRTVMIQAAIVLLVLSGMVYWLITSESGPLGVEDLQMEVSDLRSEAGEAAMLAQAIQSGKVTDDYLSAQALLVHDKAASSLKSLDNAKAERGLENELVQTRELARQVTSALERLSTANGNSAVAGQVKGEMEQLAARALVLEESLKHKTS
jgi:hypothetical protein